MKKILVTGGAGYIGSFMVKRLLDDGYEVVVIDSLERGHKEAVDRRAILSGGDILDKNFLQNVLSQHTFAAAIHFAGYISVAESTQHPDDYFRVNTLGSLTLLETLKKSGVSKFVFSSTAAVYGNPKQVPIPEDHPKFPESPYGESKLLVEHGLQWYQKTFGTRFVALRYFNASGAALDGSLGEAHPDETHLIPNIIKAAHTGSSCTLYGTDYQTLDGTCVRDYIHVLDLVEAHILALKKIENEDGGFIYNVGTGKGFTNKQIIAEVEKVSGKKIQVTNAARRAGDPAILIADNSKIVNELSFKPKYSDIETVVQSAWRWHTSHLR